MVNWHEVTPLSRILALIVFVGVIPLIFFYLGMQYQDMLNTKNVMRTYDFPKLQDYKGITVSAPETAVDSATTTPY